MAFGLTAGKLDETEQLIDDKIEEQFDDLVDSIPGDAVGDPDVLDELKRLEEKIENGERITNLDQQRLKAAIDGATLNGTDNVNFGALDNINDLTEIRETLPDPADGGGGGGAGGGGGGGGPPPLTKPTTIIYNPDMPAGDVVHLGNGVVMIGTGGDGELRKDEANLADVLELPVGVGEPVPDSSDDRVVTSGILLMNPAENEVAIHYVVNDHDFTMQPGFSQRLSANTNWTIEFHRGTEDGTARYQLRDGTYQFGSSDKGWELYRKSFHVTLDNAENQQSFEYMVNDRNFSVPAHESREHASSYPIVIRFDRGGTGQEGQKKITENGVTLSVGVSPVDDLWDLFPAENVSVAGEPPGAPFASGR